MSFVTAFSYFILGNQISLRDKILVKSNIRMMAKSFKSIVTNSGLSTHVMDTISTSFV